MNAATLLSDLRGRGIRLSVSGERLSVDAPKGSVTPDLRNMLKEHKADLIRLLGEDEYEVAWRAAFMLTQVPPRGPVRFLVARPVLSDTRGLCLSCDAPLGEGQTVRCTPCVRAAERVLNELREGVRSPEAR
jgi:hypothetical protein